MSRPPINHPGDPAEQAAGGTPVGIQQVRQDIQQTLDELATLAAGDLAPGDFYRELLSRVQRITGALGAAVWIIGAGDAVHLFRQRSLDAALAGAPRTAIDRERARLQAWLADADGDRRKQTPASLLQIGRVAPTGSLWGLLTVYLGPQSHADARLGLQKFVDAVAAIATDYQARHELRHWNQDRDATARLHDLAMAVHQPWSRGAVLAEVAGEGRRFLDCDRVIVATRQGGRYRVAAASGAATLNRRSEELKQLEKLIAAAMQLGQPMFYEEPTDAGAEAAEEERPPQIDEPLTEYLDESATRKLAIVPLAADRDAKPNARPAAALVVEQMSDRPLDASLQPVWMLADHAAVAVDRATRLRRLPVVGPLLGVDSLRATLTRRWLPRGAIAAAAIGVVIATLLLVKTEYTVRVTGELAPATQRSVFAPADGVVMELHVEHSEVVTAGQLLASLRSPDLEIELTRVRGAIATAEQELAAARTARLEALADPRQRPSQGELAAEVLLAEQQLETLRKEQALLLAQREQLQVISPIAGSVVTWDPGSSLTARPVMRGQRLLAVADLTGEWRLRLQAADRHAGPILDANQNTADGVPLRFVTAGHPEQEHHALATDFHLASEPNLVTGENQLRFEATLAGDADATGVTAWRPGAEVIGQVECGRRSLAYVWLGELYEEFRRRFF